MPRFIKLSLVETDFTSGDNGEWITKVSPFGVTFVSVDHVIEIRAKVGSPEVPASQPYTCVTLTGAENYITVAETPEQILEKIRDALTVPEGMVL
jgi:hypothetical protein